MPETRLIDGREMLPPEPLERAVAALAALLPGQELVLLLNCEPLPLYTILDRSGHPYHAVQRPAGHYEIHVRKT